MKETKFIETVCRIKPHSVCSAHSPKSAHERSPTAHSEIPNRTIPYNLFKDHTLIPPKGVLNLRPMNPFCPDMTDGYNHLFAFDHVLGESADQRTVFELVGDPMVGNLFDGFNGCLLCYGQTNTGKTYTMCGGQQSQESGLISQCLAAIFGRTDSKPDTCVSVSYIEIYNECAYDLLANSIDPNIPIESWPRLILRDDESGSLAIQGLSHHSVSNYDEAMNLFSLGNYNKIVSSTPMNLASSRSHCIFTIELRTDRLSSKLDLVDLAGSERVWKSKTRGDNLREARYINKSLHFLEHVVLALATKSRHIPYRNSILTNILRDSIGGRCRTCLIANISVLNENLKETLATCRFAQRCSQVKVDLVHMSQLSPSAPLVNRAHLPQAPYLPIHSLPGSKFVFEDNQSAAKPTVRDLLDESGANLTQFPRTHRTKLIERIRNEGMDVGPINSVGDLCAIIQVLVAKLAQSDEEKRSLRKELENFHTQKMDSSEPSQPALQKQDISSSSSSDSVSVLSSNRSRLPRDVPVISINLSDFDSSKPYSPPQWRRARTQGSFEIPTPVDN